MRKLSFPSLFSPLIKNFLTNKAQIPKVIKWHHVLIGLEVLIINDSMYKQRLCKDENQESRILQSTPTTARRFLTYITTKPWLWTPQWYRVFVNLRLIWYNYTIVGPTNLYDIPVHQYIHTEDKNKRICELSKLNS